VLRSDNRQVYDPILVKGEDLNQLRVLGRMVWRGG